VPVFNNVEHSLHSSVMNNVVESSCGACQSILTQDLNMKWIAAKFVSHIVTDQ
jgi:hypothetical protein